MSSISKGKEPVRYEDEVPRDDSPEPGWVKRRATAINATRRTISLDVTEGLRTFIVDSTDTTSVNSSPEGSPAHSRASSPEISQVNSLANIRANSPTPPPPTRHRWSKQYVRRRSSGLVVIVPPPRPQIKQKAATAPPGTLTFFSANKPQPPRRAISARLSDPFANRSQEKNGPKRWSRVSRQVTPLFPRLSKLGTSESRSPIIRRKKASLRSSTNSNLKRHTWKVVPPETLGKYYKSVTQVLEDRKSITPFSEKTRVKETLRNKRIRNLDTTKIVDFKARKLPITPSSVVNTPRELYGLRALQPTSAPKRSRSPQERLHEQRVYRASPVRLPGDTLTTAVSRKATASLEPFVGAVQGNWLRQSDDAAVDDIVAYFASFGIIGAVQEDELDQYWVDQDSQQGQEEAPVHQPSSPVVSAKALKTLGLDEWSGSSPGLARSPGLVRAKSSSKSTKSSAKSDKSVRSPSPTPRQRLRLRRRLFGLHTPRTPR